MQVSDKSFLVDSHCHLDCISLDEFDGSFSNLVERACNHNVKYMLCVSINPDHFEAMQSLTKSYPNIYLSIGQHPLETGDFFEKIEKVKQYAQNTQVVAIGETGLDYYYNSVEKNIQIKHFVSHLEIAKSVNKPVIIHSRDARKDTIDILRGEKADEIGGVMHCFTESWEMAKKALDLGFYISFSGILTFNSASELRETASKVPMDRLLIETDSPYLAPVPYRGRVNHPGLLGYIVEKLAKIRNISTHKLGEITSENFFRLFKCAKNS